MYLRAWELHPKACRIEKAEKTCLGTANKAGVQWCGPYTNANRSGFLVYPPVDMEFTFDGEAFKVHGMEDYGPEDYEIVKSLVRPNEGSNIEKWCFPGIGRTKTTVGLVEKNVIQLWTGLIFETPPGWCMHIRSPINFPRRDVEVMEAVLETDWMQYDIWINLACMESGKRVSISKNSPIAQLVPARREGFKAEWSLERRRVGRDTPEADRVFSYWLDYNKQKFEHGGKQALTETLTKDSTTYFRERNRMVGRGVEACPHMRKMKTLEQEREEFRDPKPHQAEFFSVFDKDPRPAVEAIARGKNHGIRIRVLETGETGYLVRRLNASSYEVALNDNREAVVLSPKEFEELND